MRRLPGDGSGLGCTGSASSTVGSLELLGTGPKMPAGSEPAHPWEWCPAPRKPPASGPVMFDQPPDAFCCLIPARRSAGGRAEDPTSASRGPERTLGLRARGHGRAGVCSPRLSAWGSLSLVAPWWWSHHPVCVSWDTEKPGMKTAAIPPSHPIKLQRYLHVKRRVQNYKRTMQDIKRYVVYKEILQIHKGQQ